MLRKAETSNVSRREFLTVAGSAAAASSLGVAENASAVSAATLPVGNYVMAIDFTQNPITYTSTDPAGKKGDAYKLNVPSGSGNSVSWNVITSGATPKHCGGIFFLRETPFVDSVGRPMYAFVWTESESGANVIPLNLDPDASGTYEYRVVVLDRLTKKVISEDPKIIVGSGNIELRAELRRLKDQVDKIADLSTAETKAKLSSIETSLETLIQELK